MFGASSNVKYTMSFFLCLYARSITTLKWLLMLPLYFTEVFGRSRVEMCDVVVAYCRAWLSEFEFFPAFVYGETVYSIVTKVNFGHA